MSCVCDESEFEQGCLFILIFMEQPALCCLRSLCTFDGIYKSGKDKLTHAHILSVQAEYPYGYSNFSKLTSKKITYLFLPLGVSALYNKH